MAGYRAPTQDQVREALRRITTLQLRRVFFEGLKNPLWVKPLAKEGAFRNPPESEVLPDGLIRDVYWPEIDYLIRAASAAPRDVVDVLLRLQKSNNPWVRRGVFTIGASIPAGQAARLRPLINSWVSTGFGWRTDPREMVGLAVNLLKGGEYEAGKWFAGVLFKPGKTQVLDEYWYAECLPRVVGVLGEDGLSLVLPWLVAHERSTGRLTRDSDLTAMSRDSLRMRSQLHTDVEQALVDAVRDTALTAMATNPAAAVSLLLSSRMVLARRIAMFALSEALTGAEHEDEIDRLLVPARQLLLDESSFDDSCRIEYGELARSASAKEPTILQSLGEVIYNALSFDDDRLRQWIARDGAVGAVIEEQFDDYKSRRLHRWLSAIGDSQLPEQLQSKLTELDDHLGVMESPLKHVPTVTSWTGPNSPIGQDEMLTMSAAELVAHLESWHAPGRGWGPEPSHEGQGRELTAILTTNPRALSTVDGLVERLRPIYVRAILQGWSGAIRADLEPDWHQAVEVIEAVLTHADESPFPLEGDSFDDDADFRLAKMSAVRLLEEIAQRRSVLNVPDEMLARFAEMLVTLADDETAWSEYIGHSDGGTGTDPLSISLNWQWPVRLRGLIYLMHGSTTSPWYGAARSALEAELSRDDTRGASRAVLGEGLGRLLATDPEWLQSKITGWFGGESGLSTEQQIALTTAMAVHQFHPKLYDLLGPSIVGAIGERGTLVAGWRAQSGPLERIGEWVIDAIVLADRDLSDPAAQAFFGSAPAQVRGEALGRVAWAFMHAERVEDAIRDRFATLWDERVTHVRAHLEDQEELGGFYWVVKSKKFPPDWWLPRLKEALELHSAIAKERYMIGEELATAASVDPATALSILKLLLEGQNEGGIRAYDLARNAVPKVIATAIGAGDIGLKSDAEALMNELGAKGYLSLEAEVKAVLEGGKAGPVGNN